MSNSGWVPPVAIVTADWLETELRADLAPAVYTHERAYFDRLAGRADAELLLFGAGNLGRRTLAGLRRVGVEPAAFVDNDISLHGSRVEDVAVVSAEDASHRFGDGAVVVSTIWTPWGRLAFPAVARQMRRLGNLTTIPFVPLFWKYQEEFLPSFCLDAPHLLYLRGDNVRAAFRALADDTSRKEYLTQLSYLLSSMDSVEVTIPPDREWYFPHDLIELSAEEVFVDCGAYDGDTIESFIEASSGIFRAIVAFEPDPDAAMRLDSLVERLSPEDKKHVRIEHLAVGAQAGSIRFEGGGTPGSRISETGTLEVECVTLDSALAGLAPTFIKMDIEGAEEDALLGAAETIRTCRPTLAICIYHLQSHLHRLPILIGDLCPEYTLFLRRQGRDGDLVCFAIPNEKLRSRVGR